MNFATPALDRHVAQHPEVCPAVQQQPASQGPGSVSELSDAEQFQRDLETLDRIERQREEVDPCFFSAMGGIAARRISP